MSAEHQDRRLETEAGRGRSQRRAPNESMQAGLPAQTSVVLRRQDKEERSPYTVRFLLLRSRQGHDKPESKIASITAVVEHIEKDSSPDEWQQNHGIRNKACIRNLMPLLASTSERVARRHTQS